jgi:hypothetical protein
MCYLSLNLNLLTIDEVLSLNNYGLGDLVSPIELEIKGTYKVRNEIETKRKETKSTKTKRNTLGHACHIKYMCYLSLNLNLLTE